MKLRFSHINGILNRSYKIITDRKEQKWYQIGASFDTETTSTFYRGKKIGLVYAWALCIDGIVIKGRHPNEFSHIINLIAKSLDTAHKKLIIYVHNLSYDFQFICQYLDIDLVFSHKDRRPIKVLLKNGIELRDSLVLTGMTLAKLAETKPNKYDISKLYGDLDYALVRGTKTPLSRREWKYIGYDVLILEGFISKLLETEKIYNIPLTKTGYVRKDLRKVKNNSKPYREIIRKCTIETVNEYKYLKQAFSGGFTHANYRKVDLVLDNITAYDIASSYPTVMVSEKFPMGSGIFTTEIDYKNCTDLWVGDVTLEGVEPKLNCESYITSSKCYDHEIWQLNNGRVYRAKSLKMFCCNIDLEIIQKCYTINKIKVTSAYVYKQAYLPKGMYELILQYFTNKTTLKDADPVLYLKSKENINSLYGACVTDILKDEKVEYHDGVWKEVKTDMESDLEKYNNNKNRCLSYQWGVFVTAYARRNLFDLILNAGKDFVYADTDSVYMENGVVHEKFVAEYNNKIINKIKTAYRYHGLDYDGVIYKSKRFDLGVFEFDGFYEKFKTLGAKRYLCYDGVKYKMTLAGVNKKAGCDYLVRTGKSVSGVFDIFTSGVYFPPEAAGKKCLVYVDSNIDCYITDYLGNINHVKQKWFIHMSDSDYNMCLGHEFADFLEGWKEGTIDEL